MAGKKYFVRTLQVDVGSDEEQSNSKDRAKVLRRQAVQAVAGSPSLTVQGGAAGWIETVADLADLLVEYIETGDIGELPDDGDGDNDKRDALLEQDLRKRKQRN